MSATACRCLLCGNVWVSNKKGGSPVQCPKCKRKDWDGLHNSYGRLLVGEPTGVAAPVRVAAVVGDGVPCSCALCGGSWVSRSAASVPLQCPKCKKTKWRAGERDDGVPCACVLCGGSWVSRSAETVPEQCPKCKKTKWQGVDPFDPDGVLLGGRCECRKCGNVWVTKVGEDRLPKTCPKCHRGDWSVEACAAFWDALANPVLYVCENVTRVSGVHKYQDSMGSGICARCGWNNKKHAPEPGYVSSVAPLTADEIRARLVEYNKSHPDEPLPGGFEWDTGRDEWDGTFK